MGRGNDSTQVYLVDYGISKKYRVNGQHMYAIFRYLVHL